MYLPVELAVYHGDCMMARLTGRERTLHATRRAPAHTPDLIRYTKPRDTIRS
jgi:hypothetical protein